MSGSTSSSNYIGSGSDTITVNLSEDQAAGEDAQFTVNVDGQQIGGVQTVTASHAAGQDQAFTFAGNYGPGSHNVVVTFGNNFIYPGTSGDRNLYVDGVTYDGQTVSNTTTAIYNAPLAPPTSNVGPISGNAVYTVNDTTPVPAGAQGNASPTPGPVSVGDGADTLVLNMAEDAYQGDAQFTVSVDGKQVGGTQTTTASFGQGQAQEFDVHGNFGSGTHTVSVDYLNDYVGGYFPSGTPGLPPGQWADDTVDRNLYVMGVSLNGGSSASGTPWELSSSGSHDWSVTAGSSASTPTSTSETSANATVTPDSLTSNTASTGMNFIASPDTSASSSTTTDSNGSISASSGGSTTNSTPGTADIIPVSLSSGATQTAQDFSVPSTTTGSSASDTTTTSGGSVGNWWMNDQGGNMTGSAFPQHG